MKALVAGVAGAGDRQAHAANLQEYPRESQPTQANNWSIGKTSEQGVGGFHALTGQGLRASLRAIVGVAKAAGHVDEQRRHQFWREVGELLSSDPKR
jgi:hypothetical protein